MPNYESGNEHEAKRAFIVDLIKEKGPENPEIGHMIGEWKQAWYDQAPKGDESKKMQIDHIIDEANIYVEAGHVDVAIEQLYQAYDFAYEENDDVTAEAIKAKVIELKQS